MANESKVIGLDLTKRDGFTKAITGRVGDKGESYAFRLFNNGVPYDLTQATGITLLGLTPSGYYVDSVCFPQPDGTVTTELPAAFNAEMGYFQRCFIRVNTTDGDILSTQDMIFYSYGDADMTGGNAQDYISRVEQVVAQINQMADQLEDDLNGQFEDLRTQLQSATNDLETLETTINEFMNQFTGEPLLYKTSIVSTQDWNTLKTVGRFQVANMTGANIPPTDDKWGVLDVMKRTDTQFIQEYTGANGTKWFRGTGDNPPAWRAWQEVITSNKAEKGLLVYKNTIILAQDWNTITGLGIYQVRGASGANKPDNTSNWGVLEVLATDAGTIQRFTDTYANSYVRRYSGNPLTWGAWKEVGSNIDAYTKAESDSRFVSLTAAQTIGGIKTFSVIPKIGNKNVATETTKETVDISTLSGFNNTIMTGGVLNATRVGQVATLVGNASFVIGTNWQARTVVRLPASFKPYGTPPEGMTFSVPVWVNDKFVKITIRVTPDGDLNIMESPTGTSQFYTLQWLVDQV